MKPLKELAKRAALPIILAGAACTTPQYATVENTASPSPYEVYWRTHTPSTRKSTALEKKVADIDVQGATTVLFGGLHGVEADETYADENYFTSLLPQLSQKGYKTLALEIEARYQQDMDNYLKIGRLQGKLSTETHITMEPEKIKMLKTARKLGMKVICADYAFTVEAERPKNMVIGADYTFTVERPEDIHKLEAWAKDVMTIRDHNDWRIAGNIRNKVQPGEKVVGYFGRRHLERASNDGRLTLPECLGKEGTCMAIGLYTEEEKKKYPEAITKFDKIIEVPLNGERIAKR